MTKQDEIINFDMYLGKSYSVLRGTSEFIKTLSIEEVEFVNTWSKPSIISNVDTRASGREVVDPTGHRGKRIWVIVRNAQRIRRLWGRIQKRLGAIYARRAR